METTNTLEREDMRFIINGRTFDTATAIEVAVTSGAYVPNQDSDYRGAEQLRFEHSLYRTSKGSLFIHEHETIKFPKGKPVVSDKAREVSFAEAFEWIQQSGAAVLDDAGLTFPDEA